MSEYIIKGDDSYQSIPVIDAGDPLDYSMVQLVPVSVEFGTSAEPVRIWQSGTAFLDASHYTDSQGYHHYVITWNTLPNWSGANTNPHQPYRSELAGNIDTIYIGAVHNDTTGYMAWNETDVFPNPNGALFNGTFSDMGVVEAGEWDKEPSADPEFNPDNLGAIGGEFADTDRFDATDNIGLEEIKVPTELQYGGLITAYRLQETLHAPNLAQLNDVLFNADFWQNLKNRFEGLSDPLSMVLDTIELPYTPDDIIPVDFKLGGIVPTNNQGNPISVGNLISRYEKRPIGNVNLKEVWGTEKDYSQCSIQIYLPYAGVRDIDVDLAINYNLTLNAIIDRWNGDIIYLLHCSNKNSAYKYMDSEFVAYRWVGNCAKKVPLGRVDTTNAILGLESSLISTSTGVMFGGALGGLVTGGLSLLNANFSPTVQSSGNLGGSVGRMDLQKAYLIIKRGVPSYPANWRSEIGAPRYQELQVSDLSGYTEFYEVHADDINDATDSEKAEIENLLKNGVFIE